MLIGGANEPEGTLKPAVVDIDVSAHLEVLQKHLRKDTDFLVTGVKRDSGLLALVDVFI